MSSYRNLRSRRRSLPNDNLMELARVEEDDGIMRFDEIYQALRGGRGRGRGGGRGGRGRGNRREQLPNDNDREPLVINNIREPLIIQEVPINGDGNEGDLQAAAGNAGRPEQNAENAQGAVNEIQEGNNGAPQNVDRNVLQENAQNNRAQPENNGAQDHHPPRVLNLRNAENLEGVIPRRSRERNYGPYNNYNVNKIRSNSFKDSRIYSLEKSVYHLYKVLKDKTPTSNENSIRSTCSAMPVGTSTNNCTSTICQHAAVPPAATMPLHYSPAIPVAPPMPVPMIPTSNYTSMPMVYTPPPTMPMANMLCPAIPTLQSSPMPHLQAMMGAMHPYNRAPVQQLQTPPTLQPPRYTFPHFY